MTEAVAKPVAVATHTHPHTGEFHSFSFTVVYPNGSAEVQVHLEGPRSRELDLREIVRLELSPVIEAIEAMAASSNNILLVNDRQRG